MQIITLVICDFSVAASPIEDVTMLGPADPASEFPLELGFLDWCDFPALVIDDAGFVWGWNDAALTHWSLSTSKSGRIEWLAKLTRSSGHDEALDRWRTWCRASAAESRDSDTSPHSALSAGLLLRPLVRSPRRSIFMIRDAGPPSFEHWLEQQPQVVFELTNDAVLCRDRRGRITAWNAGASHVYGYEADEIVGQSIEVLLPDPGQGEEDAIRAVMQEGIRLDQFETRRRHRNGTLRQVVITALPIRDHQQRVVGAVSLERDVTHVRRSETDLMQAQEAAAEATKTRAEFLANISHELRTPLTAIIGMTQMALSEPLADHIRDYLETVDDSGHNLLTLLDDILNYSKIESGNFTLEHESFEIRNTIEDAVKTLSNRAFSKGLELVLDIGSRVPERVCGDRTRLRQVLTNLLSNAIKFTEQGEIICRVAVVRQWSSQVRLRISVQDTGIGISVENQERIQQPFMQVDSSTTRHHAGTGLGLAISSELLGLMGSRLEIESQLGEGSRFSFDLTLPLEPTSPSLAAWEPSEALSNLQIIALEPQATHRSYLQRWCQTWGVSARFAEDLRGLQTLLAESPQVDAILASHEIDGQGATDFVRQIDPPTSDRGPRWWIMTSPAKRPALSPLVKQHPRVDTLMKPITPSDLHSHLQSLIMDQMPAKPPTFDLQQPPSQVLRILVAEDTPANQKVLRHLLETRGHHVTVVPDGQQALEQSRRHTFDLILMDVQMPVLDGYAATRAIRQWDEQNNHHTPIVAMTAHAMKGEREKSLRSGMDAHLTKPIDAQWLVQTVEQLGTHLDPEKVTMAPSSGAAPQSEREPEQAGAGSELVTEMDRDRRDSLPIDWDDVMQRLNHDRELFEDFLGYFHEDLPGFLQELDEASYKQQWRVVASIAHRIKGLAASLGARDVVTATHRLEQAAMEEHDPEISPAIEAVRSELDRLNSYLATRPQLHLFDDPD